MKSKWHLFLAIGLIALLASSITGCASSYQEGYTEGFQAGYSQGHTAGVAECGKTELQSSTTEYEGTAGLPAGTISWSEAEDHIGERTTVCGPVVDTYFSSGSSGQPTFLNIGKPYPDPGRFAVVIWGENRANFPQAPESYYSGKTICVTELIEPYKGSPQIEAKTPSDIQEQ